MVHSIIADDQSLELQEADLAWSDEEDDEHVDHMVKLISEAHPFTREMFIGGASAADLERIRMNRKDAKEKKDKEKSPEYTETRSAVEADTFVTGQNTADTSLVAHIVTEKIGQALQPFHEKLGRMDDNLNRIAQESARMEDLVSKAIEAKMATMQEAIVGAVTAYLEKNLLVAGYDDPNQEKSVHQTREEEDSRSREEANEIVNNVVGELVGQMQSDVRCSVLISVLTRYVDCYRRFFICFCLTLLLSG